MKPLLKWIKGISLANWHFIAAFLGLFFGLTFPTANSILSLLMISFYGLLKLSSLPFYSVCLYEQLEMLKTLAILVD